jgi:hypothetical protein
MELARTRAGPEALMPISVPTTTAVPGCARTPWLLGFPLFSLFLAPSYGEAGDPFLTYRNAIEFSNFLVKNNEKMYV